MIPRTNERRRETIVNYADIARRDAERRADDARDIATARAHLNIARNRADQGCIADADAIITTVISNISYNYHADRDDVVRDAYALRASILSH